VHFAFGIAEEGVEMNVEKTQKQDQDGTIRSLILYPTYRCTAECSCCFTASSTRKGRVMELSDIQDYMDEARKAGASSVAFFGGEPFLYFDLLKEGIEYATGIGLQSAMPTNAFWAASEKLALERLNLLKERGLVGISVSADPYHCEYVPFEHILNAIEAAIGLKAFYYAGNRAFDGKGGDTVVRRAREIAARLLPHETYNGKIDGTWFIGTAAEVLAERAEKQSWEKCTNSCMIVDSSVESGGLHTVSVHPYGHVSPDNCIGISIGNARETKLSEIIATYDPQAHPILEVVHNEGAVGLARMAIRYGFEPTEYVDACHLCYEARKVLLDRYPEHLAPAIYYERAK